jgi:hypothetical protein
MVMLEGISHIIGCHQGSICGGELWHWRIMWENFKVSTMHSLDVDIIYFFDICNDACMGPMSSLAGHEGPKFAFVKVFHVYLFCTLVGQTLFCCNESDHGKELPLRVVSAVLVCAVS